MTSEIALVLTIWGAINISVIRDQFMRARLIAGSFPHKINQTLAPPTQGFLPNPSKRFNPATR